MFEMFYILRPRLCTWREKWIERPPNVIDRKERTNALQIRPRQDLNSDSDLWANRATN